MRSIWRARELSTLAILIAEVIFFAWYLWPEAGRTHPFLNAENALLILKYSSIYGIAAVGAAVVIISGGIDLAPGAVIALASVVTGHLVVEAGVGLGPGIAAGMLVGGVTGLLTALLIVKVGLPPFIATLGMMGIARGLAFIITEGQYFDVSSKLVPGFRPLGLPPDWLAPVVMFAMAVLFQVLMTRFQWGRAVFSIGGNETAALFSGIAIGRIKTSVYVLSGVLASIAGVVLVIVQGQGKADLATGYELDIIASAVVGGASLAGGRGSVMGAVLGTLIFGVLRNALPQIPGATFYDRLIVGLVVIIIVVMDQLMLRRSTSTTRVSRRPMKGAPYDCHFVSFVVTFVSFVVTFVSFVVGELMKRIAVLLGLIGLVACGGSGSIGCSAGGPAPAADAGKPVLRFAVIPKALDIPVFNYAKIGAERTAQELGGIEVLWNAPVSADQLKQKEILESYITQRVDGIAISVLNGDFLTETINRAIDAGIPVVTWDSDAPKSKRMAFYGVDDRASGIILGEQTIKLLDGKGKVAIITSMGATNLQNRLDGAKEALAKAPGIEVVEVFDIKEDAIRAAEIIASGGRRYPDLAAWISVGGWPVFTRNATATVDPAKTKVISFDTIDPALDLLREGKVQVLLGQKYFGWGGESVRLLHAIKNGQMPASPIIDSGVDVVTRDNVEQYAEQWKKMQQ